jgi:ABC-type transport system involved in multi-copper enzyme maturation permease subunit
MIIRTFRAELLKLRRRSILVGGGATLAALTLLGTGLTFATAKRVVTAAPGGQYPPETFAKLAQPTGLTLGFGNAIFMVGILVFVVFLTSATLEYGQGTVRALLARQPGRAELLTGKALALLAATAAAVAAAEALSIAAAVALAHLRGIDTARWLGDAGISHAVAQYGNALLSCACYGLLGLMLGVLIRSTPLALGIGLAWLLPVERTLQNSWNGADHWLPGLVLGVIGSGGTATVTYQAAVAVAIAYVAVAILAGAITFSRRDITA